MIHSQLVMLKQKSRSNILIVCFVVMCFDVDSDVTGSNACESSFSPVCVVSVFVCSVFE